MIFIGTSTHWKHPFNSIFPIPLANVSSLQLFYKVFHNITLFIRDISSHKMQPPCIRTRFMRFFQITNWKRMRVFVYVGLMPYKLYPMLRTIPRILPCYNHLVHTINTSRRFCARTIYAHISLYLTSHLSPWKNVNLFIVSYLTWGLTTGMHRTRQSMPYH